MKDFNDIKKNCKDLVNKGGLDWCFTHDFECSEYNCPKRPPLASCGTSKKNKKEMCLGGGNGNLTKKQLKALRAYNDLESYKLVADKMGISKPSAYRLIQKAFKKVGGVTISEKMQKKGGNDKLGGVTAGGNGKKKISLHNDSIKFNSKMDYKKIKGKIKHLKYTTYKQVKRDDVILTFFENSTIKIQFREEILGKDTDSCLIIANQRILNFVNNFKYEGIYKIHSMEQISRHYAICGTAIGKKYIREGRKMFIYHPIKDTLALTIDYSDKDKKNGTPHLESPDKDEGKEIIDRNHAFIEDVSFKPHYRPSEVKTRIDTCYNVLEAYSEQIKRHLKVQDKTEQNLELNNKIQKEMLKTLKKIQNKL